ncbi:hypothetical protein [Streptomyces sp. NPDC002611]
MNSADVPKRLPSHRKGLIATSKRTAPGTLATPSLEPPRASFGPDPAQQALAAREPGSRMRELLGQLPWTHLSRRRAAAGGSPLVDRAHRGGGEALSVLVGRHQAAVCGYLNTCLTDPAMVDWATEHTFRHVVRASGHHPSHAVPRIHLLDTARSVAAGAWRSHPESCAVTEGFREWIVESVGPRPPQGPAPLYEAYRCLPARWQTALWHLAVEDDHPALISDMLGLSPGRLALARQRAQHMLSDLYLTAYRRAVSGRPACTSFVQHLAVYTTSRDIAATGHAEYCSSCSRAEADLTHLDIGVRLHLPALLLGWWDDTAYRQMRYLALRNSDPRGMARRLRRDLD